MSQLWRRSHVYQSGTQLKLVILDSGSCYMQLEQQIWCTSKERWRTQISHVCCECSITQVIKIKNSRYTATQTYNLLLQIFFNNWVDNFYQTNEQQKGCRSFYFLTNCIQYLHNTQPNFVKLKTLLDCKITSWFQSKKTWSNFILAPSLSQI